MAEHTTPSEETLDTEADDATITAGADREPTPDEEAAAESNTLEPEVAEAYKEALERGAGIKGEGQI